MTTIQALLVFLGIPLGIVGLIAAIVYAAHPRQPRPTHLGPPVGVAGAPDPCTVHIDERGREVHEPAMGPGGGTTCWTLSCAECATSYREGTDDVHFTGAGHAVAVGTARGWVLAGHRMRCRNCG